MSKAIVFITGGNNGLGFFASQQLAASGKYHVLMGSRDLSKAEKAIRSLAENESLKVDVEDVEAVQIDVTSDESIYAAAKTVEQKYGHIDILMVNAGISQTPTTEAGGSSLREIFHRSYDTNLFGAAITVDAFLPLLRKSKHSSGKRIAFTSSGLSSLQIAAEDDDLYSAKKFHIYRSSKTALNMVMLHYARTLEAEGFTVGCSDPGYCATDLNAHSGVKDPREGAKVLIEVATGDREKVHGWLIEENGRVPW